MTRSPGATSAAAHLLLLVGGLTCAYLLRDEPQAQKLWRALGSHLSQSGLLGVENVVASWEGPRKEQTLRMSDEELRGTWLLPALRRLNAAYLQASEQLERQKAQRLAATAAASLLTAIALRGLSGHAFWGAVAWAGLALVLYFALDAWLVSPLLREETEDAFPAMVAQRHAVRRGCLEAAALRADAPA